MAEEYDYLFKSIVVGDGGVGKTALTLRFSKGFFTEDYKMTIGVDFHVKTIDIETAEGLIKCKLQLWDTGGQERFSSIRPMYYRGSLGAVLVFDLTNYASFEHLPQWIEEVRANIKTEIPLLLVGNKSDLADQRAISIDQVNNFTRDFNLYYMETSAKTGDGVGDCFYILACLMIGSGVPEQLIANKTVYSPGKITIEAPSIPTTTIKTSEPEIEYSAPPVPEPPTAKVSEPKTNQIQEPKKDFAAPPVPEPDIIKQSQLEIKKEPEVEKDFAAPPIPERPTYKKPQSAPKQQSEPQIELPEPSEIEFKTPEEILSEIGQDSEKSAIVDESIKSADSDIYKPKMVPFSNNMPSPAPKPENFPSVDESKSQKRQKSSPPPFTVEKVEEPSKPTPGSMEVEQTSKEISKPPSQLQSSQSLVDYMPKETLSKKERKKLAKQKKREEKEKKRKKEREKQEKLLEGMKKGKKEKKSEKQKSPEFKEAPSLFQTLTQRSEGISESKNQEVLPFVASKKDQTQETSKLRIIPNVEDVKPEKESGFIPINSTPSEKKRVAQKSQDLLICKQCGAVLSADYAYCNKCGSKL